MNKEEIKGEMQTVFNKVAKHLLTQKAKSVVKNLDGELICRYRGDNGRMCAAGCLLTDKQASRNESSRWHTITYNDHEVFNMFSCDTHQMIDGLQRLHDYSEVFEWKMNLIKLAKKHSLSSSVVDEDMTWSKEVQATRCLSYLPQMQDG